MNLTDISALFYNGLRHAKGENQRLKYRPVKFTLTKRGYSKWPNTHNPFQTQGLSFLIYILTLPKHILLFIAAKAAAADS